MATKAISKQVNRSLRGGHLVIGPVLFPAVSSRLIHFVVVNSQVGPELSGPCERINPGSTRF